jgi:N-acetylmuramoyl-L-alanine amidase
MIKRPSPNHDARTAPVSMLVLHYTGMESAEAALERLADPAAKVSSHYVVLEDGSMVSMVPENRRAWHAGVSRWRGATDINARSVGIEIVNGGHDFGLPPFPDEQIAAVIALSREIIARHGIAPGNVAGHSDIAPERKTDPGERFPWWRLAEAGVGLFPAAPAEGGPQDAREAGRLLEEIGYGISWDGSGPADFATVLAAFQRRYRPSRVDGVLDGETAGLIAAVHGLLA